MHAVDRLSVYRGRRKHAFSMNHGATDITVWQSSDLTRGRQNCLLAGEQEGLVNPQSSPGKGVGEGGRGGGSPFVASQ